MSSLFTRIDRLRCPIVSSIDCGLCLKHAVVGKVVLAKTRRQSNVNGREKPLTVWISDTLFESLICSEYSRHVSSRGLEMDSTTRDERIA